MSLVQIAYTSRPFGFDAPMLSGILNDARTNNRRDGITGALICRSDLYCQLLEGPEQMVNATFARILRDDRHLEIRKVFSIPVETRQFAQWDMLHDPAQTWMWSRDEVSDHRDALFTKDEVLRVFAQLAQRAASVG